jgi:proteasome lid subunit RPN8/RPN11
MFYVSISKGVLNKVMDRAKATDNEVIGILVGSIENHTIMVEDAVSGEQESDDTRATLPPKTIAEVTDKILKGEIKGRIVGWYHSHPGFGIFMSSTDVNTQKNLQQFSSKVTAMIVDPDDEDFGFFTLHENAGVVQLEDDQVNVYEKDEEKIPEAFSSPPKIPRKEVKRIKNFGEVLAPPPEPRGPNKFIIIAVVVAVLCAAIAGIILFPHIRESPKYSSVDTIMIFGERERNQENISIYSGEMQIRANVTVVEGRISQEGLRFYISLQGGGWRFLGNDSIPINNTFSILFNTINHQEGIHSIKVNFTDSRNHTWEKVSEPFIIDNIPDPPNPRFFIDPDAGNVLDKIVDIYAEVKDEENNIYNVEFYYLNISQYPTQNWTQITNSRHVGEHMYATTWDTGPLLNGTYSIKVEAQDRNLYMGKDEITVNILHGG